MQAARGDGMRPSLAALDMRESNRKPSLIPPEMRRARGSNVAAFRRQNVNRREALAATGAILAACHSRPPGPSIEFTRIPQTDPGGKEKNDIIEGIVKGGRPGQRIVLYSRSGKWWVQPLRTNPFTAVQKSGKWTNATHLGTEYAALLIEPGFRPPFTYDALPSRGGYVAAVAVARGQEKPPSVTILFSGYEWRVRDAPSSRGGWNLYASSNAWTDAGGAMHLGIKKAGNDWTCAEVSLTRSLGYGTYRFVVRDISQLEPSEAFGMFTWDYAGGVQGNREMDIEISRWGDASNNNAQFVVQPYSVAANVFRFKASGGPLTHTFRWEPGRVSFRTVRGSGTAGRPAVVAEHLFTSGVPVPGIESVRMNHYVFRDGLPVKRNESEVVVERFEYLP
jgi:hypothetical protein